MHPRFTPAEVTPQIYQAMAKFAAQVHDTIDPQLAELVKIRASQINGCGFCLDMHTKDARTNGETEQRLYALPAWRETPFYTEQERAALALTEAVTLVHEGHVPDAVYEQAAEHFDQPELAGLIWAITTINTWNRLAIASRLVPGSYHPEQAH